MKQNVNKELKLKDQKVYCYRKEKKSKLRNIWYSFVRLYSQISPPSALLHSSLPSSSFLCLPFTEHLWSSFWFRCSYKGMCTYIRI